MKSALQEGEVWPQTLETSQEEQPGFFFSHKQFLSTPPYGGVFGWKKEKGRGVISRTPLISATTYKKLGWRRRSISSYCFRSAFFSSSSKGRSGPSRGIQLSIGLFLFY